MKACEGSRGGSRCLIRFDERAAKQRSFAARFCVQEACEIQSKGTRALRSNQRFHNMADATESPIIGSLDARCRSSRAFP